MGLGKALHLHDLDAKETMANTKEALEHGIKRQELARLLLIKRIALHLELLCIVGHVPIGKLAPRERLKLRMLRRRLVERLGAEILEEVIRPTERRHLLCEGHLHARMHTDMHACEHAHVYVATYFVRDASACMHVCMYACVHACMRACMRACVCVRRHLGREGTHLRVRLEAEQCRALAAQRQDAVDDRRIILVVKL